MSKLPRGLVLLAACAFAVACDKGPAETALQAANAALDAATPEIKKYAPSDLTALTDTAAQAKAQFDKGEYKAALASAQDLTAKVKAGLEAATRKKDELVAAFTTLKGSLPVLVDGLKARLTELSGMKKLPKGIDKTALATAQTDLGNAVTGWTEAMTDFDKGDIVQAVEQANRIKASVETLGKTWMPPLAAAAK